MFTHEHKAMLKYPRMCHAACSYENNYLFVSGSADLTYSATVEVFSMALNKWVDLPQMPVGRQLHAMCVVKNTIYVICGVLMYLNKKTDVTRSVIYMRFNKPEDLFIGDNS